MKNHAFTFIVLMSSFVSVLFIDVGRSDMFSWTGGITNYWSASGCWYSETSGRQYPGQMGDSVSNSYECLIYLDRDISLSDLKIYKSMVVLSESPVTLSLISPDGTEPSVVYTVKNAAIGTLNRTCALQIGTRTGEENLVLDFASPILFTGDSGGDKVILGACITGGTDDAPSDVVLSVPIAYSTIKCFITNPENTFRGDIYVGVPGNAGQAELGNAYSDAPGYDGMFGDPANKIIFGSESSFAHIQAVDGLKRRVEGSGTMKFGYFDAQWGNLKLTDMVITKGGVFSPSVYTDLNSWTDYGDIDIQSNMTTFDADSVLELDVGSNGECDKITVSAATEFVFSGAIEVREHGDHPVGTYWDFAFVSSGACSFAPEFVTPGFYAYSFGNPNDGWTFRLVKVQNQEFLPDIVTVQASGFADDFADIYFDVVSVAPSGEGTVRVYVSENGDMGSNPAAWERCVVIPERITEPGRYSYHLEGLSEGVPVYVRCSISNVSGEKMSATAVSFTPYPFDLPDVFEWISGDGDWYAVTNWTHDSDMARGQPGKAGDTVIFTGSKPNRVIYLNADTTVGTMQFQDSYEKGVTISVTNGPVVLTFEPSSLETNMIYSPGNLAGLSFGNLNEDFTIRLTGPLLIKKCNSHGFGCAFNGKVSGGTADAPADIIFEQTADEWTSSTISFSNTSNDFVGDLFIGPMFDNGGKERYRLNVGHNYVTYSDTLLGDLSNIIYLGSRATLGFNPGPQDNAVIGRKIDGQGTVYAMNKDPVWGTETLRTLNLGDGATVTITGSNRAESGTITFISDAFCSSEETRFVLDATDTVRDSMVFQVNSALELKGIVDMNFGTTRPAPGSIFNIARIDPGKELDNVSVKLRSSPASDVGFIVRCTGNAQDGWIVYCEIIPDFTFLMVK